MRLMANGVYMLCREPRLCTRRVGPTSAGPEDHRCEESLWSDGSRTRKHPEAQVFDKAACTPLSVTPTREASPWSDVHSENPEQGHRILPSDVGANWIAVKGGPDFLVLPVHRPFIVPEDDTKEGHASSRGGQDPPRRTDLPTGRAALGASAISGSWADPGSSSTNSHAISQSSRHARARPIGIIR
jgi:hypothetical protein